MFQQLLPGLRMMLVMTLLTGLIYPGIVTGLCQILFRSQANGSLVHNNGAVAGSRLIGQPFSKPGYFHPRPSAAGNGYDGLSSGGSNLGPTNQKLIDRVKKDAVSFRQENPGGSNTIPADAVTASGSGLDPHISPETAEAQIARVAKARGMTEDQVRQLVQAHIERRDLGFLGEPRVNVLELNLALDKQARP